jgi:hypothetical protein
MAAIKRTPTKVKKTITKTKSKATTKKPATKKTTKTKAVEIAPNKTPLKDLTTSTTGLSIQTDIITKTSATKNDILRLPVELLEGKMVKIISQDQYFHEASCAAYSCEDMLDIELLKLSDNSTVHIKVAPNTILYKSEDETPIKAQELLDNQIIKGLFTNFKVLQVHIYKNKDDRIINFNVKDFDKYMLANGLLVGCYEG